MRTTVNLDEDIIQSAKALAERYNKTLGQVLSELARKGLQKRKTQLGTRNGIPILNPSSVDTTPLTIDEVNELRDSE
ncbi:hypothetical protein [Pelagicoccus sp. SDUM812003]|uniref:hypothetical protein n=1 Tax=Pelagicoccus sp. SDUM812003 TaxID=3041267 RepID=UPI00280CB0FB|nr:hypothetical protein [Pelagicoccus sp. SDUM812003]MDQ8205637.1 hypothetical protein [Pelagicoccus sp. SDUM812003]